MRYGVLFTNILEQKGKKRKTKNNLKVSGDKIQQIRQGFIILEEEDKKKFYSLNSLDRYYKLWYNSYIEKSL